jgi:hypothetical protein
MNPTPVSTATLFFPLTRMAWVKAPTDSASGGKPSTDRSSISTSQENTLARKRDIMKIDQIKAEKNPDRPLKSSTKTRKEDEIHKLLTDRWETKNGK